MARGSNRRINHFPGPGKVGTQHRVNAIEFYNIFGMPCNEHNQEEVLASVPSGCRERILADIVYRSCHHIWPIAMQPVYAEYVSMSIEGYESIHIVRSASLVALHDCKLTDMRRKLTESLLLDQS
jgi:hypothetical protein